MPSILVVMSITSAPCNWDDNKVNQRVLSHNYCILNLFVCANVEPTTQQSTINAMRELLLQKIGLDQPVGWFCVAFRQIACYTPNGFPRCGNLPFGVLLTKLLITELHVPSLPTDNPIYSTSIICPINALSRIFSDAQVDADSDDSEDSKNTEEGDVVGSTDADSEPSVSHRCRPINSLAEDFDDLHVEHYRLEWSLNFWVSDLMLWLLIKPPKILSLIRFGKLRLQWMRNFLVAGHSNPSSR